jgi:hypothetical protein
MKRRSQKLNKKSPTLMRKKVSPIKVRRNSANKKYIKKGGNDNLQTINNRTSGIQLLNTPQIKELNEKLVKLGRKSKDENDNYNNIKYAPEKVNEIENLDLFIEETINIKKDLEPEEKQENKQILKETNQIIKKYNDIGRSYFLDKDNIITMYNLSINLGSIKLEIPKDLDIKTDKEKREYLESLLRIKLTTHFDLLRKNLTNYNDDYPTLLFIGIQKNRDIKIEDKLYNFPELLIKVLLGFGYKLYKNESFHDYNWGEEEKNKLQLKNLVFYQRYSRGGFEKFIEEFKYYLDKEPSNIEIQNFELKNNLISHRDKLFDCNLINNSNELNNKYLKFKSLEPKIYDITSKFLPGALFSSVCIADSSNKLIPILFINVCFPSFDTKLDNKIKALDELEQFIYNNIDLNNTNIVLSGSFSFNLDDDSLKSKKYNVCSNFQSFRDSIKSVNDLQNYLSKKSVGALTVLFNRFLDQKKKYETESKNISKFGGRIKKGGSISDVYPDLDINEFKSTLYGIPILRSLYNNYLNQQNFVLPESDKLKKSFLGILFNENPINFCQTCNVNGTNKNGEIEYEKHLLKTVFPTWCDRIFYFINYKYRNMFMPYNHTILGGYMKLQPLFNDSKNLPVSQLFIINRDATQKRTTIYDNNDDEKFILENLGKNYSEYTSHQLINNKRDFDIVKKKVLFALLNYREGTPKY